MKQHLEIEYKTMVTFETFEHVRAVFEVLPPKCQTNIYFDTDAMDLFSKHIMCRIRVIGEYYEFTLKIPKEGHVLEHEIVLNSVDLSDPRIHNLLNSFGIDSNEMKEVARSVTTRYEFNDNYGTWCLDASKFANHSDYEIEYELFEANEKAYPHYLDTLKALNIPFEKSQPKYIRALKSLNPTLV